MKILPPDGDVQSLKKVFCVLGFLFVCLFLFCRKGRKGPWRLETLFALIYISKDDLGCGQYHDVLHFFFFSELN